MLVKTTESKSATREKPQTAEGGSRNELKRLTDDCEDPGYSLERDRLPPCSPFYLDGFVIIPSLKSQFQLITSTASPLATLAVALHASLLGSTASGGIVRRTDAQQPLPFSTKEELLLYSIFLKLICFSNSFYGFVIIPSLKSQFQLIVSSNPKNVRMNPADIHSFFISHSGGCLTRITLGLNCIRWHCTENGRPAAFTIQQSVFWLFLASLTADTYPRRQIVLSFLSFLRNKNHDFVGKAALQDQWQWNAAEKL
ncbi:hypothetical protein BC829DRAFT_420593 [Chytridium lagenaria]|nr:hypothetical protein BC829DRAFT_420593 [Chytridium lagenaria]